MAAHVTNHNILLLCHNFMIRPSTGYMRVGYSPQYIYIYYELLITPIFFHNYRFTIIMCVAKSNDAVVAEGVFGCQNSHHMQYQSI